MKPITLFLALLSLLLSLSPCCGDESGCEDAWTSEENTAQHEHERVPHACSPFYTCGVCAGFTLHAVSFRFLPMRVEPVLPVAFYQATGSQSVIRLLFKPPRRG
ncbi:hypothetical protein SAMN05421823_11486 [Catalinimonas alkaloidigena]|uniref:Secreted protein n=1 Tax=Catalinimonas alkaloidigena TaxID=1075417 RepID=A0A1G9TQ29_9BACT|nr:hypothetical protein [Catalinimonas alkaloidigena]SDM49867.1 hypothetical protein SAMN05421823_11486 [Catalinimonas alkaloidigena]